MLVCSGMGVGVGLGVGVPVPVGVVRPLCLGGCLRMWLVVCVWMWVWAGVGVGIVWSGAQVSVGLCGSVWRGLSGCGLVL